MRSRTLSTRRKVLFATGATLVLLVAAALHFIYRSDLSALERERLEQLDVATRSAAALVNADHLAMLVEKYPTRGMLVKPTQDAWAYVLHDQLRRTASVHPDLPPLLILRKDDRFKGLVQLASSASELHWRSPYTASTAELLALYDQGGRFTLEQDGRLWAAQAAPVLGSTGRQEGIVLGRVDVAAAQAMALSNLGRNAALALGLLLVIGVLLYRSVGAWLQREELERIQLSTAHARMNDSLAYAGRIQRALVPDRAVYAAHFPDAFLIDRPKQVVSGDFHWFHRISEHESLVATADCTGHGVPGAMLAAIACSVLNEVAARHPQHDPAELLTELNERLIAVLHQEGLARGAGDGLDIALCRIDRRARTILFAGAMRPLYWWHAGQLSVINGDRRPVGGAQHGRSRQFTCHRLAYGEGDRIYLFSDGYVDQLGGPAGERFMSARLQEVLRTHATLPMDEQGRVLERTFDQWQAGQEQLDDVCMLGLAV
ncbi:MAG: serine/threonine-protein phosphatase [Flavobacteriales bacterium]|nr:serine/threonine-protein phosphatase [Flavobacteriales bacterium]